MWAPIPGSSVLFCVTPVTAAASSLLNRFLPPYLHPNSAVFLKVDVQGYEDRVLQGAAGILNRLVGIEVELSLVRLYEGQRLFDDLLVEVKEKGFDLWSVRPVFTDRESGRLLQVDATLFRR